MFFNRFLVVVFSSPLLYILSEINVNDIFVGERGRERGERNRQRQRESHRGTDNCPFFT